MIGFGQSSRFIEALMRRGWAGQPALKLLCSTAVAALAVMAVSAWAQQKPLPAVPSFELIDQTGRRFIGRDLIAKPSVVHFGFTQCPVICPTTLYEVAGRMRELGALAGEINFIFVTVDPERDTPEFLRAYIESFDNRIIGLSGRQEQISVLSAWLGATYAKVAMANGDYTMDHAVNAFLIDRGGKSVVPLYMGDGAREAQVMQALRELARR